jgi:diaminopimelate epimerase
MKINFTKMQSCGNDYIYIDCRNKIGLENAAAAAAAALSERHFGIGGDGVILICESEIADCKMRIFNADGTEAQMCGNGIRCAAEFVGGDTVKIETLSGVKTVAKTVVKNGAVWTVNMGIAKIKGNTVNIGNRHRVFFCENVDALDIQSLSDGFSDYNCEFAEIIGNNTVKMRVYERGSGETLSCGTGSAAVAALSAQRGLTDGGKTITVKQRGGDLFIDIKNGELFLSGGAETVYRGEIYV